MSFKEELREDLFTFVAVDEFGEVVEVDGVLCQAQLIEYTADKSNRQSETFAGLHGQFSELYLVTEPYLKKHKKLPHRGDVVKVDGQRYEVMRAEDELGLMHLVLSSYRANKPRWGDRRAD